MRPPCKGIPGNWTPAFPNRLRACAFFMDVVHAGKPSVFFFYGFRQQFGHRVVSPLCADHAVAANRSFLLPSRTAYPCKRANLLSLGRTLCNDHHAAPRPRTPFHDGHQALPSLRQLRPQLMIRILSLSWHLPHVSGPCAQEDCPAQFPDTVPAFSPGEAYRVPIFSRPAPVTQRACCHRTNRCCSDVFRQHRYGFSPFALPIFSPSVPLPASRPPPSPSRSPPPPATSAPRPCSRSAKKILCGHCDFHLHMIYCR